MEINNIKLSNDEINKILHIAYKKHPLIISKIYEYCYYHILFVLLIRYRIYDFCNLKEVLINLS